MKNVFFSIIILSFLFSGCEKDGSVSYHMSANINDKAWKTLIPAAVQEKGSFVITGTSLNKQTLIITIHGNETGEYSILNLKCVALYKETATLNDDDAFAGYSGKVTITEIDESKKKLSGTFEFKMKNSIGGEIVNVTKGVFTDIFYIKRGDE